MQYRVARQKQTTQKAKKKPAAPVVDAKTKAEQVAKAGLRLSIIEEYRKRKAANSKMGILPPMPSAQISLPTQLHASHPSP